MLTNPARQLYLNMDIEKLEEDSSKSNTATSSLLAPRKKMKEHSSSSSNNPAFRIGQHMLIIRKQRENLNG